MTIHIPAWVDGQLAPVEKIEVHRAGLRHKAVSVFVMHGDLLLIQRRALTKYHTPGLWANTCCTHPNWGERARDCAERRLSEELGIRGLALQRGDRIEYRADVGSGLVEHEVVDVFVAESAGELAIQPNPDEVAETGWAGIAGLAAEVRENPDVFTPWFRIYMTQFAQAIFGARAAG